MCAVPPFIEMFNLIKLVIKGIRKMNLERVVIVKYL